MPLPCYSNGFRWSWLSHSGIQRESRIQYERGRKIAFWFPRRVLIYEEDFTKYGSENPTGWQPLRDLRDFLKRKTV